MRQKPSEIGRELGAWMTECGLTGQRLADALNQANPTLNVSQSWISRIVNGEFKRLSGKVELVLLHAGIRVEAERSHSHAGEEIIAKAIEEVWDGSLDGARAVALILRGAADLRRSAKAK